MSLDLNIVFITKSESPFITVHLWLCVVFFLSMNQENEMIHQWQDLAAMQIVVQRNTC